MYIPFINDLYLSNIKIADICAKIKGFKNKPRVYNYNMVNIEFNKLMSDIETLTISIDQRLSNLEAGDPQEMFFPTGAWLTIKSFLPCKMVGIPEYPFLEEVKNIKYESWSNWGTCYKSSSRIIDQLACRRRYHRARLYLEKYCKEFLSKTKVPNFKPIIKRRYGLIHCNLSNYQVPFTKQQQKFREKLKKFIKTIPNYYIPPNCNFGKETANLCDLDCLFRIEIGDVYFNVIRPFSVTDNIGWAMDEYH